MIEKRRPFISAFSIVGGGAPTVTEQAAVRMDFGPDDFPSEHPDLGPEAHLQRIVEEVTTDLRAKYRVGQAAHGGHLWEKPGMLDHAIEEVLDLAVYLYTLREQHRKGGPQ